jgi:hypothetical protein
MKLTKKQKEHIQQLAKIAGRGKKLTARARNAEKALMYEGVLFVRLPDDRWAWSYSRYEPKDAFWHFREGGWIRSVPDVTLTILVDGLHRLGLVPDDVLETYMTVYRAQRKADALKNDLTYAAERAEDLGMAMVPLNDDAAQAALDAGVRLKTIHRNNKPDFQVMVKKRRKRRKHRRL